MDDVRYAKQMYLKEEIIDKGFDSGQFVVYCQSLKGTEIDEYSFEELEEIVRSFQNIVLRKERRNTKIEETRPEFKIIEDEPEKPRSQTVDYRPKSDTSLEIPKDKSREYFVQGVKLLENSLSSEGIVTVKLLPPQSLSTGVLSGNKNFYPVETNPTGWSVKRQLEDFVWLRETLSNNFPGVYLPPFPPKRFRNSQETGYKQQYFLEKFINCMVRSPLLRRSSYLLSFLMETDSKIFNEFKRKSSKEKKIGKLEEFWSLEGQVKCDPIIDEGEKVSVSDYLTVTENTKKKLKRISDEIIQTMQKLSSLILDFSKLFEQLENVQSFVPDITGIKPLYTNLRHSFAFWSSSELKMAEMLKNHLSMFFKFAYNEMSPLKDMTKERDQKYELYTKTKARLEAKKDKLWLAGDINKWGLDTEDLWNASLFRGDKQVSLSKMMKKETQELDRLKDEYSFLNYQCRLEFNSFLLDNQILENIHFTEFAREVCDLSTKFSMNWGDLITSLSRIRTDHVQTRPYVSKNV